MIFSMELVSSRGDGTRFSTANTVPWGVVIPTVVEPSCVSQHIGAHVSELRIRTHFDRFHGVFDWTFSRVTD